jgi:hypothetical protein
MGACRPPNYITRQRGKNWTASLRAAQRNGASITVQETGIAVTFDKPTPGVYLRPWIDSQGNRYDSRECIPVWS